MPRIVRIPIIVALGYGAICGFMYVTQERLLFFPKPNDPIATVALQGLEWSTARNGVSLRGWLRAAPHAAQRPLILYFGGNAEDIAVSAARTQLPANYLYVNYRGYGSSGGEPSAHDLKADAVHIYDQAVANVAHNGAVIAYGRSLGSGLATHLAAHRPVSGIILVSPYDSITHVARKRYPWLPVTWLLEHRIDSTALAPAISAPALFLVAGNDRVIPRLHSDALAEVWGGPLTIQHFPSATHRSIGNSPESASHLTRFIRNF